MQLSFFLSLLLLIPPIDFPEAYSNNYPSGPARVQVYADSIEKTDDLRSKIRLISKIAGHYDSIDSKTAIPFLKRSIALLFEADEPLKAANTQTKLAGVYLRLENYDSAIETASAAVATYLRLDRREESIPASHILGRSYNSKTDFPNALKTHYEILDFFTALPPGHSLKKRRIAAQNIHIALAHYEMGYYEIATDYTVSALNSIMQNRDWGNVLRCYALKLMGMISLKVGDYHKALNEFQKIELIRASSEEENLPPASKISEYISECFFKMQKYDKAIFYIQKSFDQSVEEGKSKEAGIALNNLGEIHLALGDHHSAIENFRKALQYFEANKTRKYIAIAKMNTAKSLISQGITTGVTQLLHDALAKSLTTGSKNVTKNCYEVLSEFHFSYNQYDSAYHYSKLYNALNDKILDDVKTKKISESQVRYEINKEVIKTKYESEKKQLQTKLAMKQSQRIYLTIIVALVAISLIIYFRKEAEKAKRMAAELAQNIREKTSQHQIEQLLKDQEIENIRASLNGQELERKRIAKELHDGVGGSLAAIKIMLQKPHKDSGNYNTKVFERIDQVCEEVRTISHNLTPPCLDQTSFTEVIKQYTVDISQLHGVNIRMSCFEPQRVNSFDNLLKTDIYRMIQELTNNALKHAKPSNISIQLSCYQEIFTLMVEDDGAGFQTKQRSRGIGLKNLAERAKALNGNLDVDSTIGEGTLICIHIQIPREILTLKNG